MLKGLFERMYFSVRQKETDTLPLQRLPFVCFFPEINNIYSVSMRCDPDVTQRCAAVRAADRLTSLCPVVSWLQWERVDLRWFSARWST